MTREIHGPVERLTDRSAIIMGAFLVGALVEVGRSVKEYSKNDIADVKSYVSEQGPSFIFMRGCGEDYLAQAPIYKDKLSGYGSLHFPYQLQGRHSQKIIDEGIMEACARDGDRDRVLITTSMGLMNTMKSLMNPNVQAAIGDNRLKAIISNSGMTSRADLQPSMQKAASASAHSPHLALVGDLWQFHRMRRAHARIPHSPNTTAQEALLHHESSARMPFPLVSSQHRAIDTSHPWKEGSHRHVVEQNPDLQLFQIIAEHDAVVDSRQARLSMEASFGIEVKPTIDYRRPDGSHADDIEFIEPLAQHMTMLSDRYSHMLSAVVNLEAYRHSRQLSPAS